MTTDRTRGTDGFDHLAVAWLLEGPTQLNDQVLHAALAEVHGTAQRRRPISLGRVRMPQMSRIAIVVGAAALLVLGGAFVIGGGHQGPTTAPPPTSTTLASPSAGPTGAATNAPFGYPGAGTIEFTKHDANGNDVLWLVDPSGANLTRLQAACCGLFSPDGRQLAIAANGIGPAGISRDPSLQGVEILDAPGTHVATVVPSACTACGIAAYSYEPDAWSPNGRYIGMTLYNDAGGVGMAIADRDFFQPWNWPKLVTESAADIPLQFSPGSDQLLFLRQQETLGPSSVGPLFLLSIPADGERQLSPANVQLSTNGLIQSPASWSADGSTIVFAGTDAATGRTSIFKIAAGRGSVATTLLAYAPGATWARFSPDGSLIAFDERGGGNFHDLYVMHPDGTGVTNLTQTFGPGVCCGQWSPDGKALLVAGTTSDDSHNDLYVVAVDGSGIWQVTNDPNAYTAFLWGQGFR